MNWRIALIAAALAASGAQAQTKKELATRVLAAQQAGVENIGRTIAGQTAQRVLQAVGPGLQRMPADKRDAAAKDVQAEVRKFYDEIEPILRKRAAELAPATVGAAYEERFTEDELKQILAWLESPVSKKFGQVERDLATALAEKVVADTRGTIEPRLKTLEGTISKRLGLPAAGAASAPRKP
ncbi:MAG TPA: DUF2059 domain-containing protein [Burkholderiaceae bacterium]|nr:DUF2059 domain-containing protein [Burkholderiaceae bacterium]